MRAWVNTELEKLRELVDLLEDGLLVVDGLREGDSQPVFRTLLQLDGDVMSSIAATAFSDPEFGSAHRRHIEHVGRELRAHTDRIRRRARGLSFLVSGSGAALVGYGSYSSGMMLQLMDASLAMLVSSVGSVLVGVVVWPLGRTALQALISWRLGHERRGRIDLAIERLTG
jgi:hypothetical protein